MLWITFTGFRMQINATLPSFFKYDLVSNDACVGRTQQKESITNFWYGKILYYSLGRSASRVRYIYMYTLF